MVSASSQGEERTRAKAGAPGFLKLQRTETTRELLAHPSALHLLLVIAYRARWAPGRGLDGLSFGQARIGDSAAYGMTRKAERCAREQLERWGLVRFLATPRGTIASLLDSRVFSLSDERGGQPRGQPISGEETQSGANGRANSPREGANETPATGQLEGQLFSEEKAESGANSGAGEGPAGGQLGASNKKEEGEKERKASVSLGDFPAILRTDAFASAWRDWQAYRCERRFRPLKARSIAAQLETLASWGEAGAIDSVRTSIRNNWQGLFEPRPGRGRVGPPASSDTPFLKELGRQMDGGAP